MAFEIVFIGLVGAAVGSFLNVVAYRLPRKQSVVSPASRCPGCDTAISPLDNVPVISWLLLRGRCRHCGARISPRYPLVELITALAFAGVAAARGVDPDLVLELPFVAVLVAVAAIDVEHRKIPNVITGPAAVYALVVGALLFTGELPAMLIAGGAAFGALLLTALAYPAGMGMGDVKLAGVMGLYLGPAVGPAMFVAFLAGTVGGLAVMAYKGTGRKTGVPFGPFLALGALVGLLAGPELIDLYRDEFLT